MKKIVYSLSSALRRVIPKRLFRLALCITERISPSLASKIETVFDPEAIRRVIGFKSGVSVAKISGDDWELGLNWNDHIGYKSYLQNKPFEMAVYELVEILDTTERNIVLDIGANIGSASIPICASKGLELIAIEASKENALLLIKNTLTNKIAAQIHTFALSNTTNPKFLKFFIQRGNTGANSLLEQWSQGAPTMREFEYVPTTTLDKLIDFTDLNVTNLCAVKIDVEGAEKLVLEGGLSFLEQNAAPIIFEYRRDATEKFLGDDMGGLLNIFRSANYEIFVIKTGPLSLQAFDPENSYENVIAIKSGSFAFHELREWIEA